MGAPRPGVCCGWFWCSGGPPPFFGLLRRFWRLPGGPPGAPCCWPWERRRSERSPLPPPGGRARPGGGGGCMSRRYVWMLLRTLQASGAWGGQLEGTPQHSCEQGASQGASCSAKICQTDAGSHGSPRPALGLQRANTKVGLPDRGTTRSPVGVIRPLADARLHTGAKASRCWWVGTGAARCARHQPPSTATTANTSVGFVSAAHNLNEHATTGCSLLPAGPCPGRPLALIASSTANRPTAPNRRVPRSPPHVYIAAHQQSTVRGVSVHGKRAIACARSRAAMAARRRPRTRGQEGA